MSHPPCGPGICQGKPDPHADSCAEVNGCDERPDYGATTEGARRILASTRLAETGKMRSNVIVDLINEWDTSLEDRYEQPSLYNPDHVKELARHIRDGLGKL